MATVTAPTVEDRMAAARAAARTAAQTVLSEMQAAVAKHKRQWQDLANASHGRFIRAENRPAEVVAFTSWLCNDMDRVVCDLLAFELQLPADCAATCIETVQYLLQLVLRIRDGHAGAAVSQWKRDDVVDASKRLGSSIEALFPRLGKDVLAVRRQDLESLLNKWESLLVLTVKQKDAIVAPFTTIAVMMRQWAADRNREPALLIGRIQQFVAFVNHCASACSAVFFVLP
jgi:acyl transferase domain-containing protein